MEISNVYGPVLPPGFNRTDNSLSIGPSLPPPTNQNDDVTDVLIGPTLPPATNQNDDVTDGRIGPSLPPATNQITAVNNDDVTDLRIGPHIPSRLKPVSSELAESTTNNLYGPSIGPSFPRAENKTEARKSVIGPSLPAGFDVTQSYSSSDSDEETVGPLPSEDDYRPGLLLKYAARASKLREAQSDKDCDKPRREEWMTELPEVGRKFGLEARTFSRKEPTKTGDRSEWTETPGDRERKKLEAAGPSAECLEKQAQDRYDELMAKNVQEFNKGKKAESLMELHTKKLKRKAKEEANQPKERRPFDRDSDLKVQGLDGGKRRQIIQGAGMLGSRFGQGQGKYL